MAVPVSIRLGIYALLALAVVALALTFSSVRHSFNARAARAGRAAIAGEPCLGAAGWQPRGRPRIQREGGTVREEWLLERGAERLRVELVCRASDWHCAMPHPPPCATRGNHGI